jgi:hypothetical protein
MVYDVVVAARRASRSFVKAANRACNATSPACNDDTSVFNDDTRRGMAAASCSAKAAKHANSDDAYHDIDANKMITHHSINVNEGLTNELTNKHTC